MIYLITLLILSININPLVSNNQYLYENVIPGSRETYFAVLYNRLRIGRSSACKLCTVTVTTPNIR